VRKSALNRWTVKPALAQVFPNLEAVFALTGEPISKDAQAEVLRINHQGTGFYLKRYWCSGPRRWLSKPKAQSEWENLQHFSRWGIACAPMVAFGLERRLGGFVRGALITQELVGCEDLAKLARNQDKRLKNRAFVACVSEQLAAATRTLHAQRFAHNDLKWRNLLVDNDANLFFIDCPSGSFWHWPLLNYRIIKDLACLDKLGKYHLTQSQRLRFYLQYVQRTRLNAQDKQRIRRICRFFQGRE